MPSRSDTTPDLLTTQEVAQLLRTPVRTVRDWSYRRVGPPSVKVGTRRLYDRADVLAWLESKRDVA